MGSQRVGHDWATDLIWSEYYFARVAIKKYHRLYILLYLKWVTNKGWLDSTWTTGQYYIAAWIRGEFDRERIYECVWLSPFTVHLKLLQYYLLISYTPIQNTKFNIKKNTQIGWLKKRKKSIFSYSAAWNSKLKMQQGWTFWDLFLWVADDLFSVFKWSQNYLCMPKSLFIRTLESLV